MMDEKENMERMKEYQKVIRKILSAFEGVSFPVIVESSTGYKVLPEFDTNRKTKGRKLLTTKDFRETPFSGVLTIATLFV